MACAWGTWNRPTGTWTDPGEFVSDASVEASFASNPDPWSIAHSPAPGRLEFNYAVATDLRASPIPGWELVEDTKTQAANLERRVRAFIAENYDHATQETLGQTVYPIFVVLRSGASVIEFASMTFEKKRDTSVGYGISLAWGLSGSDQPVVFHPLEGVSAEAYPHFFHLIQVMDLGDDGTVELLFNWADNYVNAVEIWQGTGTQYKRMGIVWRD